MPHLMIDIEALGKDADSVILTIGAQIFDPSPHVVGWIKDPIYDKISDTHIPSWLNIRVDVDSQVDRWGRRIDGGTLDWWGKQSPEAIEEALGESDRVPLEDALDKLMRLAYLCKAIWSKGPLYDIVMLEHAMNQTKRRIPWKFWEIRDARTVYSLCPGLDTKLNGHIAVDDCRNQIVLLQEAFRLLNVGVVK